MINISLEINITILIDYFYSMMYTPKRPKTKRNYIDHSAYTSTFEIENDQV